jgi:ligand-binding sensor protein
MSKLGKPMIYTFKAWEIRLTIALVFVAGLLAGFIIAAPDAYNSDVTGPVSAYVPRGTDQ